VRLRGGDRSLPDVVRALDAEGVAVASLPLHAPTLDDVFLEKTGRSLEGSGDGEGEEAGVEVREPVAEGAPA
jgi:ABC-2 type transport system ATP-binding protein